MLYIISIGKRVSGPHKENKMENANNTLGLIILDNGGGITLQMGKFAHVYEDAKQAADDIAAWLGNQDTSDFEGHDSDAATSEPTDEEITNGGYRTIRLDAEVDKLLPLAREVWQVGGSWANGLSLSDALRARANEIRGWTDASAAAVIGE